MHCSNCNTDHESSVSYCPNCGEKLATNSTVPDVKSSLQAKTSCLLGNHDWSGCTCKRCGATRNQGHRFQPVDGKEGTCVKECAFCGETKESHHFQLIEGKCKQKCLICDEIEEISHDWKGAKCTRCGEYDDVWYVKSSIVILLLILFFPVGFYLMWKYQPWHKNIKIGITIVISVFFLIAITVTPVSTYQNIYSQLKNSDFLKTIIEKLKGGVVKLIDEVIEDL